MVVGTATVDFRRRNDNQWTRHDHNGRDTVHQDWNRSPIDGDEQEERKRLQEERQRIQEAHKLLNEEKEKLARDRQQLEVNTITNNSNSVFFLKSHHLVMTNMDRTPESNC